MTDNDLKQILKTAKTIASVGLSGNQEKESYWIAEYLQSKGYRIIPVNPTAQEILGQKCYPDLASIPDSVDVVQIFRKPEDTPPIAEQAVKIKAKVFWMQPGTSHQEAANIAQAGGLTVVLGRCMRIEHRRLMGGLLSFLG